MSDTLQSPACKAAQAAERNEDDLERARLLEHKAEFWVKVLHHPDHEPRHIKVRRDATLLDAFDEAAKKLDVKLLPNPHDPLDVLHGIYEDHHVGAALDPALTVEEFLRQEPNTHRLGIELVLAIEVNTRWRVAPEREMTPRAILTLAGLSADEYSLYRPEGVVPLPPDTPVKLHRGERFEAQRDGKYGAEECNADRIR